MTEMHEFELLSDTTGRIYLRIFNEDELHLMVCLSDDELAALRDVVETEPTPIR